MGISGDKWRQVDGDETIGIEYPLNADSVVVDVGGYRGNWVEKVWNRYKSNIYVFEPVEEYYVSMVGRFKGNEKIRIINKGLGESDSVVGIRKAGDVSRCCRVEEMADRAYILDAGEWFKQFKEVDLLQINCEGGEYGILKRLIEEDLVRRIKDIKVQFHNTVLGAEALRDSIRAELSKTHKESYNYPFVWESWKRI